MAESRSELRARLQSERLAAKRQRAEHEARYKIDRSAKAAKITVSRELYVLGGAQ